MAAPLGVQVGLVQVRAQEREHRPVTLGEVRSGPGNRAPIHRSDGLIGRKQLPPRYEPSSRLARVTQTAIRGQGADGIGFGHFALEYRQCSPIDLAP